MHVYKANVTAQFVDTTSILMDVNTMREQALALLRNRSRLLTYDIIAEKTGLTVSWIRLFARGGILDPKLSRVEILRDFLAKEKSNDKQYSN